MWEGVCLVSAESAKTPQQAKRPPQRSNSREKTATDESLQSGPSQSLDSPRGQILHLQRTIGNQAVQRLARSGALQAKLRVSRPGDIHEQEADRISAQVMRMAAPPVQRRTGDEGDTRKGRPLRAQLI